MTSQATSSRAQQSCNTRGVKQSEAGLTKHLHLFHSKYTMLLFARNFSVKLVAIFPFRDFASY